MLRVYCAVHVRLLACFPSKINFTAGYGGFAYRRGRPRQVAGNEHEQNNKKKKERWRLSVLTFSGVRGGGGGAPFFFFLLLLSVFFFGRRMYLRFFVCGRV